jgi:hypothetical protein
MMNHTPNTALPIDEDFEQCEEMLVFVVEKIEAFFEVNS